MIFNLIHRLSIIFTLSLIAVAIITTSAFAEKSSYVKKLESIYNEIDIDLLKFPIEEFEISNFTYQKDLATFEFKSGKMYLIRYVDDRPNTAIFVGDGHALIKVPSHAERMTLQSISKDSTVDESFEYCFIRMADDFDLKLKEKFTSIKKTLKWKEFQITQEEAGEFYFKPTIKDAYDNYFQLTRSLLERNPNGYFWIDFNRYSYMYDPNRYQPNVIAYEFELGDWDLSEAVYLNSNVTTDLTNNELSKLEYPSTPIGYESTFELEGLNGDNLKSGKTDFKIKINSDSMKIVTTFLHYNLDVDSVYVNGYPADFSRRKDFNFLGVILPKYYKADDTLTLTYWYHGKNFDYIMPFVENRKAVEHNMKFIVPSDFYYIMPDMGNVAKAGGGKDTFTVYTQLPYSEFYFQGYAKDYDTVTVASQMGIPLTFLKSSAIKKGRDCYVPDEIYEASMTKSFNFMASKVGAPIGTFGLKIFPDGFTSMPGLVEMPQLLCYDPGYTNPLGGFNIFAGHSMARQWFAHQVKPYSDKEEWLELAAAEYLSLLFIENEDPSAYYSNLMLHKDSLNKLDQVSRVRPLYAGERAGREIMTNKGIWFFHMLRMLMLDTETLTDASFSKFFHRLTLVTNGKRFTNADIKETAEKYYGEDLSWFFNQWLFNYKRPKFDVTYEIQQKGDGYYVQTDIAMSKVDTDFKTPVLFNIADKDGKPRLFRKMIENPNSTFTFGPFPDKPSKFTFNEFFSVLSDDNVHKK